jgi:sigma-B regulation protein RsbU (phosphoserine phosphatase)
MMLKNKSIVIKLILLYTLSGGLIFLLIFSLNYHFSRTLIEKKLEDNAKNLVLSKVNRIEATLLGVQKIPENLACFLESGSYTRESLLSLLRLLVGRNPDIYGAAIAFEPDGSDPKLNNFAPYFFKRNGRIEFVNLGKESYRYTGWDWYQIPKELNRPSWSEPYFDEGAGNVLMSTYSVPFYVDNKGKKKFAGILTVDIQLDRLQEVVSSIKVLQTGYGFLISRNGTILTHPIQSLIMNETLFGVAEARNDKHLREIGRKMIRGESGLIPFESIVSNELCWMYYTPIPSNGWSLAVLFPQREYVADIRNLNRIVIILALLGLVLLAWVVEFIARKIAHPLRKMAEVANTIATGNLDIDVPPVKSGDEVGQLADAFRYMKESLKDYIGKLTETTAAKERIESELKIAHDIQMGILPKIFPAFPDRTEFDIYAVIEPAKEVGGDFYDFFFIDDNHFCFVIGDVSGKGVPASLFMAVTKTLIKATASRGINPGDVLTNVNRELNNENDSCMFVTIFCGIIDIQTGLLSFANGGHNLPFITRRDQKAVFLEGKGGLVLGAMEPVLYETSSVQLKPGDTILMYTDGVTEAMAEAGNFYSEERLKSRIDASYGGSVQETVHAIMEGVHSFTKGAPQSDDITLLMIQYYGMLKS